MEYTRGNCFVVEGARLSDLFKYSMFSAPGDIIGNFTTFEGCPLDTLNIHSFLREPWISVRNAANCCKMISANNDI